MCEPEAVSAGPGDLVMSLPDLARACGMSTSALRNWTRLPDHPLRGTPTRSGRILYTWAHLRAFGEQHPELPGVRKIISTAPHMPARAKTGSSAADVDPERDRSVVRNLRAAVDFMANALLTEARSAEQAATAHREQIESLVAAIRSLDDALTQLSEPITPND